MDLAFGPWLRQRRRVLDLTQEDLAQKSNCSTVTIRKIESGDLAPSKDLARQPALALDVPAVEQAGFIAFARSPNATVLASAFVASAPGSGPTSAPPAPAVRRFQLPAQMTTTIGRERDTIVGCKLLRLPGVRLMTLTGPPGTGKTRLSLEIGDALQAEFAHGACFVPLAPLGQPQLVEAAIAQALEVREPAQQSLLAALQAFLRDKRLLLVLDNFEHLLPAAPLVAELLVAAPGLVVLVSSREPLRIYGERELPVAPLALPPFERSSVQTFERSNFETLTQYAAIRLFVERAQAIKPDFELTQDNAATVAQICTGLDGLPLAIEMAAARVKWHSTQALLAQLRQRLPLLASGLRGLDPRRQTPRGAIAWSYNLLDTHQRRLFAVLAIFVGGCTIEAAEAVCGEPALLDALQSLVDKSLLHYLVGADDEPRFTMLETLREYACEQLEVSGESAIAQQRHAEYYAALAQTAALALMAGAQQVAWLNRLEIEHNNMRAALAWSLAHTPDPEFILQFVDALFVFWSHRSYFTEGRRWLEAAAARTAAPTLLRARVLNRAGGFAWNQGDDRHARALQEQALAIQETMGDHKEISRSLQHLGILAGRQSDYERAGLLFERSLAIERELDNKIAIATIANNLAMVAQRQGEYTRAESLLSECIALNGEMGNRRGMAHALHTLGMLTRRQDKYQQATALFQQSVVLRQELGDKRGIASSLEYLAEIAVTQGHGAQAAHLLGAAEALRKEIGAPIGADERGFYDDAVARLHALLDSTTYAAMWKEGRSLTFAQVPATAQIQL